MPVDPVIDLSRLDAEALRDLCAELLAGMKTLEQRVAVLEARPAVVAPQGPQWPPPPWEVTSGVSVSPPMRGCVLWNGPVDAAGRPALCESVTVYAGRPAHHRNH